MSDLSQLLAVAVYFADEPRTFTEAATELHMHYQEVKSAVATLADAEIPGQTAIPATIVNSDARQASIVETRIPLLTEPLRITPQEAVTLLMTLETLENAADLVDPDVVRTATAKLRRIAGGLVVDVTPVAVPTSDEVAVVRDAVTAGRVLRIGYRDAAGRRSERLLDPQQMFWADGWTFLRASDHGDTVVKSFRTDRIESAEMLDEPARSIPLESVEADDPHGLLVDDGTAWARVAVAPDATWVTDYAPLALDTDEGTDEDGRYPGWIPVGGVEQATRFLLRTFPGVQANEPEWVREAVHSRAQAALREYAAVE